LPLPLQALAERSLTAEDGAHKQKTSKNASDLSKPDDLTFKAGVAASKEGHGKAENSHISNPKKVVADAHTQRESKKGDAKDAKDGDKEAKDVEESPQAADANAQNNEQDKEDEESQAVHDSENAKKANEINEAEGSDKEE
jgi:hypothetical protein